MFKKEILVNILSTQHINFFYLVQVDLIVCGIPIKKCLRELPKIWPVNHTNGFAQVSLIVCGYPCTPVRLARNGGYLYYFAIKNINIFVVIILEQNINIAIYFIHYLCVK